MSTHPSRLGAARTRFAHPSERALAALLEAAGVAWEYEPVEFALAWNGRGEVTSAFRPDFWLPQQGCFVELTTAEQRLVTRKNAKVRRLHALHPATEVHLVYRRQLASLLERHGLTGQPMPAA